MYARSEGCDETAHLRMLVYALVAHQCDKYQNLMRSLKQYGPHVSEGSHNVPVPRYQRLYWNCYENCSTVYICHGFLSDLAMYKLACAHIEDSDQTAQSDQRLDGRSMSNNKDWSNCMDGQTDFECSLCVHANL